MATWPVTGGRALARVSTGAALVPSWKRMPLSPAAALAWASTARSEPLPLSARLVTTQSRSTGWSA